ncbi:Monocarboxylate transporter 3 [Trachymyrmex septentrionalis]|uniref:Monocarboxylate transporter 3 n=1 Tax=Trachymyrmex septentrionalis TaxID=34720 RepID=A0A151JSR8_9HYME|nr:PREDICTED: monocarboxylate transporter 4-like [Trachymyrmex septentrionalis]KYN30645.1 Monocarboxylate transporter 3 [Trachymyrmex septentrionalis]
MSKQEEMSTSRESHPAACTAVEKNMLTRKKARRTKMIPPDGGWGWVVLFSALIVNFLIPGTVKSFGVLFVEFLHVFKASSTAASWMPALCYFLYSSLGPLSSILSTKYSYRTVTLIGGTFAASGMMLSYFANSVTYLYISYGLMVGIGAGLSFPPTVYIVTQYFEKLRGMANGVCISGSAIGTIVLPPLLQHLLDRFGYRGAVLIMGAITLNTLVCGLLYHPVEQHMKIVPLDDGIDNEALTLDESIGGKRESAENMGEDAKSGDDEPIRKFSDLSHNVILETTEKASCKPEKASCKPEKASCKSEKKLDYKTNDTVVGLRYDVIRDEIPRENTPNANEFRMTIRSSQEDDDDLNSDTQNLSRRGSAGTEKDVKSQLDPLKIGKNLKEDSRVRDEESKRDDACSKSIKTPKRHDDKKTPFFDLSVLRDPIYLVILISNSTSAISNTNFMILLPSYAIAEGFDKNSSALLLSIVSALDLVGRIGGASLSDIDFVPKYYYFVGGLGTSGIALALLPMATSYTMLSFFCGLFGLSSGMYIGITTVILADMLGTEKLSSSYGISLFVNGVLQLIGPPICGVIFENILSYKPIFLAFGIILILGTALWAVVPLIKRNNKKDIEAI